MNVELIIIILVPLLWGLLFRFPKRIIQWQNSVVFIDEMDGKMAWPLAAVHLHVCPTMSHRLLSKPKSRLYQTQRGQSIPSCWRQLSCFLGACLSPRYRAPCLYHSMPCSGLAEKTGMDSHYTGMHIIAGFDVQRLGWCLISFTKKKIKQMMLQPISHDIFSW